MNSARFIENLIESVYPDCAGTILETAIIQYLHKKTRSVTRGSKARGSFGNLYAIYVLVEDYVKQGFEDTGDYDDYEGMQFTDAFNRQRELPFGEKLQNHALNHRCNQEFIKYFPDLSNQAPIIRDTTTNRYWFNEHHLIMDCNDAQINLARLIIQIIDEYVSLKRAGFETFFETLERFSKNQDWSTIEGFIHEQLSPQVDARIFEIMSYCILRQVYEAQTVFFGDDSNNIQEEPLRLHRTGRTNSNDGGIDFIMRPIGRIFQVTEVLDFRKYFLDIDKINKYPISFVVKVDSTPDEVMAEITSQAEQLYPDPVIRQGYLVLGAKPGK